LKKKKKFEVCIVGNEDSGKVKKKKKF